jgi:CRISPR/Cas system type I-B associated protein Csh2 (Cas7 group RAMP superfamily)
MVRTSSLFRASVLGIVIATSACSMIPKNADGSSVTIVSDKKAAQALIVYQGALNLTEAAVDSGKLKGEDAAKVSRLLEKSKRLLDMGLYLQSQQIIINEIYGLVAQ